MTTPTSSEIQTSINSIRKTDTGVKQSLQQLNDRLEAFVSLNPETAIFPSLADLYANAPTSGLKLRQFVYITDVAEYYEVVNLDQLNNSAGYDLKNLDDVVKTLQNSVTVLTQSLNDKTAEINNDLITVFKSETGNISLAERNVMTTGLTADITLTIAQGNFSNVHIGKTFKFTAEPGQAFKANIVAGNITLPDGSLPFVIDGSQVEFVVKSVTGGNATFV